MSANDRSMWLTFLHDVILRDDVDVDDREVVVDVNVNFDVADVDDSLNVD